VECSSVVFDEEENAHTEEQKEAIEFPDTTDDALDEIHEKNDTHGLENTSKSSISDFIRHTVKSLYEQLGDTLHNLPNSANAWQCADFSQCWAVCRIQPMLGSVPNSANAGQCAEFSECWAVAEFSK
jgi:predicted DNA-binding protein YlxM (UPF0122 family)